MLNELVAIAEKWLGLFKEVLHNLTLSGLLEFFIIAFIITVLLLVGSKLFLYLLNYTIELAKILLKVVGILVLVLLVLVLLSTAWDSKRPCRFKYEKYITRCVPQHRTPLFKNPNKPKLISNNLPY